MSPIDKTNFDTAISNINELQATIQNLISRIETLENN